MDYIGKQIGKYIIKRLIGEGGMASVYEGEHEFLGTKAAIKILNRILSTNKQIRERFKNEARLMASFDHPNITRVLDFEENDSYLAIAMELLSGEDLSDRIKSQGKLTEKEVIHIFDQTLSAFDYAHNLGIVHRDIKPSNIFILPNGTIKILDFGIAKLFGQGNEMTQTGTQMGTPIYMSPEQVKGDKSIDHRSDIYSLGVTMYYAIEGKPPYDGNTSSQFDIFNKILYEPLPEVKNSSFLVDIIRKACEKDRAQRFQSCEEWLLGLKTRVEYKLTTPTDSDKTINENSASDKTIVDTTNDVKVKDNENSSTEKTSQYNLAFVLAIFSLCTGVFLILFYFKPTIFPWSIEKYIRSYLIGKMNNSSKTILDYVLFCLSVLTISSGIAAFIFSKENMSKTIKILAWTGLILGVISIW